jgi:hypothetical protein
MAEHIGTPSSSARLLLASPDTLHFSADIQLSDELHEKLEWEKLAAQEADKANAVHCPHWLGAQVLPHMQQSAVAAMDTLPASPKPRKILDDL